MLNARADVGACVGRRARGVVTFMYVHRSALAPWSGGQLLSASIHPIAGREIIPHSPFLARLLFAFDMYEYDAGG